MKRLLFFISIFVMGMAIMPNVYAEEKVERVTDEQGLRDAITTKLKTDGGTIIIDDDIPVEAIIEITDVSKPIVIDLNGKKISREDGNCVFTITRSTVTFKDSSNGNGQINKEDGSSIYAMDDSKVTIESGTYNGGIVVWGDNPTLNIKGGTIISDGFAVSGNGTQTTNSTVTISGGNLTSNESAAIYQPQSGTLTITNGNIKGKIGVVSRGGTTTITGGNITAEGVGTDSVGDAKQGGVGVKLPLGTAVIVDNTEAGYENSATVKISGGVFKTSANSPVISFDDNPADITVEKGATFDKSVNPIYLEEGLAQDENGKVVDASSLNSTEKTDNTKNPDTSDINLLMLISLITLSGVGLGYIIKKRRFH